MLQDSFDIININPYRVSAHAHNPRACTDRRDHFIYTKRGTVGKKSWRAIFTMKDLYREKAFYHVIKIFYIPGYMKANIITLQQAADDLSSPGKNIKCIGSRKCSMMKKTN